MYNDNIMNTNNNEYEGEITYFHEPSLMELAKERTPKGCGFIGTFRAIIYEPEDEEIELPPTWIQGNLMETSFGSCIINLGRDGKIYSCKVYEDTISQWTGLWDANGNQIFPKDIVQSSDGRYMLVNWEKGTKGIYFAPLDGNEELTDVDPDTVTVVGNIITGIGSSIEWGFDENGTMTGEI